MSNQTQKLTRQQIYEKIRETSKDEYILTEMKRLGFWKEDKDKPSVAKELITRRAQIQSELNQLNKEQNLYRNPEEALKQLHKERKKEALLKREETKQKNNKARYQKALNWFNLQNKLITYLGEHFSLGLKDVNSNSKLLEQQNLPVIHDSKSLADLMGISINELRFLSFQKDVSKISHYQQFEFEKKSGGTRLISAPMPRLKRAQYWILDNLLDKFKLHESAHGFITEKSILTNAQPHVGKDVVINLDLKDFFPTVNYPRVKGLFTKAGYSENIATILGLLCTQADTQEVELDGTKWFVSNAQRFLPQGAPTSPMISNIICRKLDARLKGMASKLGFDYSRYADDLSFSGNNIDDKKITQLLWRCRKIVQDEGFIVHPDKTKIMRKHKKQEVTGVVVNEKPSVDRKTLKRFRALLHQIDLHGPQDKKWGNGELFASIEGYANFVAMINPTKGIEYQKKVVLLKQKYNIQSKTGKLTALNRKLFRAKSALGKLPRENWWQAKASNPPVLEKTAKQIHDEKLKKQQHEKERAEQQASPTHFNNPWDRPKENNTSSNQETTQDDSNYAISSIAKSFIFLAIFIFIIMLVKMAR